MSDFPLNPDTNQHHTINGVRWKFNGTAWDLVPEAVLSINGLTGSIDTSGVSFDFAGVSASGDLDLAGTANLQSYTEVVYDKGAVSGSIAFDFENGSVQKATVEGTGTNTYSFSNVPTPTATKSGTMTLLLTNGATGSSTVWHPSVQWPGGVDPSLSGSGFDILSFVTTGGSIYGFVGGINFS